ncbi:sugar ABC transporter substrate-binding protein [Acidisoma cellulosilytica]|uniref:Sugar ABC transporter substrate-binding protein n=1 Tax=Acidisoma cellulosilyticum TaxID=2802395 RepID=A0A963Z7P3_9PROT|nr:sugar ABC transporter substrate-binding protein [Acidisoma cellulosilyticum]MCB8883565.1 sugar ABC transporter substrate-binding protein [Acidisoma cellulosilyticum]
MRAAALGLGLVVAGGQAQAAEPVLGYAAGFLTDPFQAVLVQQALATARAEGFHTLPATNANGDAGKQISDIHNLIATGAKVLIINPTDSEAIIPALAFAAKKKVPVVAIDTAPAGGSLAMVVRADNAAMGAQACQQIGKALGGQGIVLSLMGDQATTNGRDRTTGFNTCLKASYRNIKLIQEPTNWKADQATAIAQTIVTSTPKLSAIYMQSDSVMLAGVVNVLKTAHKLKPVGQPGHIVLVSIDGTPLALQDIRKDLLDSVVSQPLNLYIKYGVYYAKAALAGKTFAPGPTDHDSTIIAKGKIEMDLLTAPIVTKANVDDPSLWGNQTKS